MSDIANQLRSRLRRIEADMMNTESDRDALRNKRDEILLLIKAGEINDTTEKYNELLYAVATVHPGETRHETALRYIREAEKPVELSVGSYGEYYCVVDGEEDCGRCVTCKGRAAAKRNLEAEKRCNGPTQCGQDRGPYGNASQS